MVTVGTAASADVVVRDLVLDDALRPTFTLASPWGSTTVRLALRGAHQALNAAMSITVAALLDVDVDGAAAALASTTSADWRMELVEAPGGVVVLNDAYNASPSSMHASLRAFAALAPGRRHVAVVGDMLELGECSRSEHEAVGTLAGVLGIDVVVAVGEASRATADAAAASGAVAVHVADRDAALRAVAGIVQPGDAVLVKASRLVGLEAVAHAIVRGEMVA